MDEYEKKEGELQMYAPVCVVLKKETNYFSMVEKIPAPCPVTLTKEGWGLVGKIGQGEAESLQLKQYTRDQKHAKEKIIFLDDKLGEIINGIFLEEYLTLKYILFYFLSS